MERDILLTERYIVLTERDIFLTERDILLTERDILLTQIDILFTDRPWTPALLKVSNSSAVAKTDTEYWELEKLARRIIVGKS